MMKHKIIITLVLFLLGNNCCSKQKQKSNRTGQDRNNSY